MIFHRFSGNLFPISPSIRTLSRIILLTLLFSSIVGCFAPAIVADRSQECQLVTKKLDLVLSKEGSGALMGILSNPSHNCHTPECLLIFPLGAIAISVTSLIVSGSIVVAGNTIHWIEKEGRCENSTIQTLLNNFVGAIKTIGGKTIQSTTELITWFKQHLE
jgi:hypothetical protein